jgi:hypothetical protein
MKEDFLDTYRPREAKVEVILRDEKVCNGARKGATMLLYADESLADIEQQA